MAVQPIDSANRALATMAGHAAARVAETGGAKPVGRLVRLVELSEIGPQAEAPAAPNVAPQPPTKAQVVAAAAQQAVVRQDGLAPLLADLAQALEAGGLPPAVRLAASRLLAQAKPLAADADGPAVARALSGSGLLLEAGLAANPAQSPVGVDLKAGLLMLRQALVNSGPAAPRRNASGTRPPPPYRGGPTQGQRAAPPSLEREAPEDVQRQRLAEETESALARVELMQIASLPERETAPVSRWMFEAPVQTPQGPAIAQFEISRDGRGQGANSEAAPTWRARFGLDIEPLGPVTAHLALAGGRLAVSLWAARPDAAELLRSQSQALVRSLAGTDTPAEVAVYHGTPPAAATVAGQLLDQAV